MKLSTTLLAVGMGTGLLLAANLDQAQAKGPGKFGKGIGIRIGNGNGSLSINSGSVKFRPAQLHVNQFNKFNKIHTIKKDVHHCHIDWRYSYNYTPRCTHYCNPYVLVPVEPIPVVAVNPQLGETPQGLEYLAAARQAFMGRNLPAALSNVQHALVEMPSNPNAHQLKSLTLFAMGQFRESAGSAHIALTSGRIWNWPTLRSFYISGIEYSSQLRRLEMTVKANPGDAGSRLLLGYHYMMMGHGQQAAIEFQTVVRLEPRDQMAAQMLTIIGGNAGMAVDPNAGQPGIPQQQGGQFVQQGGPVQQIAQTQQFDPNQQGAPVEQGVANGENGPALIGNENGPQANIEAAPAPGIGAGPVQQNLDPAQGNGAPVQGNGGATEGNVQAQQPHQSAKGDEMVLLGSFKATPAQGIAIQVDLREDGTFTWTVDAKGDKKTFSGKFTLDANNLSMARDNDGQKMVGALTPVNPNSFNFKLQNAKEKDTGLTFNRI